MISPQLYRLTLRRMLALTKIEKRKFGQRAMPSRVPVVALGGARSNNCPQNLRTFWRISSSTNIPNKPEKPVG
jgi:hypothetical protein